MSSKALMPHPLALLAAGLLMLAPACSQAPTRLQAPQPVTQTKVASKTASDGIRYKQQTLSVADVDRSAAFYIRHFGYRQVQRQTFPELTLVVLERPDHRLQLMSGGKVVALDWRHSMGFFVRDFDTMAKAVPLLRQPFQVAPGGPRILFAKDPDGYPVEVIEDLP